MGERLLSWRVYVVFVFFTLTGSAQCTGGLDLSGLKLQCQQGSSTQTKPFGITAAFSGTLTLGSKAVEIRAQTLSGVRNLIEQASDKVVTSELKAAGSQNRLVIHSKSPDLMITGTLKSSQGATLSLEPAARPDFTLSLDQAQKNALTSNEIKAVVHADPDVDLAREAWTWTYDSPPLVRVTIEHSRAASCDQIPTTLHSDSFRATCLAEFLLARTSDNSDIVVGMNVEPNGLKVLPALLSDKGSIYTVNDRRLKTQSGDRTLPVSGSEGWRVNWYRNNVGCRFYDTHETPGVTLSSPRTSGESAALSLPRKINGIKVNAAKVYDVTALRRMLADTANQLAAISGFNAASITGALTNVQGLMRDAKFLNAQVTTTATPSIMGVNSSVGGSNSTVAVTPGMPTQQSNSVTVQCPIGTLPTMSNGNLGCTTATSSTQPSTQTTVTTTTTPSVTPTTTVTSAGVPAVTNTTTTTTPSMTGTVPAQPASTAFSAPGGTGLSSSDILAEQVELNAQITTLRLLLQGALSDQYLLKNSRAVESRQQTTIGFTITLNPPKEYRHAVAEVRVVIVPQPGAEPVSIMNLLPADKTYNVARITSKEDSFGFGVALQVLSFGLNAGKSEDRLFLAKDADTVSLQFPRDQDQQSPVPDNNDKKHKDKNQQREQTEGPQSLEMPADCRVETNEHTAVFGWQFRPVFNADYLASGRRQVFAQIALSGSESSEPPKVYLQTVWREYDNKTQVVGQVIAGSCVKESDQSATVLVDQPVVRDMHLTDLGSGQVKLTAKGEFFSTSLSVLSGANTSVPLAFDGKEVEVFGTVNDLLESGDLTVVGANGRHNPFAIRSSETKKCEIVAATLVATPRSDGNSVAKLELTLGADFKPASDEDGLVNPLVLIGKQVYGIREYPFLQDAGQTTCSADANQPAKCTYIFVAPTADLRNARTFLARDLAWDHLSATGRIQFIPSFTALTSLSPDPAAGAKAKSVTYSVTGYDFDHMSCDAAKAAPATACVTIFFGGKQKQATLNALDRNVATFDLDPAPDDGIKSLQFRVEPTKNVADSVVWDLPLPSTASASKPTPSPGYLREGDSQKVTFSGVTFTGLPDGTKPTIAFEACDLTKGINYDPKAKSLDIVITTCVTGHPGHKDLSASVPGVGASSQPVLLSIEVLRQ